VGRSPKVETPQKSVLKALGVSGEEKQSDSESEGWGNSMKAVPRESWPCSSRRSTDPTPPRGQLTPSLLSWGFFSKAASLFKVHLAYEDLAHVSHHCFLQVCPHR
jgi:hypothetical protein